MSELGLDDRTARLVAGTGAWAQIAPILKPYARTITAAIAYVGSEAARQMTLAKGSTIIVDASERSVRAGSTDPAALLEWAKAGVMVYSLENLHAKMILASRPDDEHGSFLAVGSANVSAASANRLYEAIVLTDSGDALDEALHTLMHWKIRCGAPLTVTQLKNLEAVFASKRENDHYDGATGNDDLDEEEAVMPWLRPTSIYLARVRGRDDASEEAIHKFDELAKRYGCVDDNVGGGFEIDMCWWDDEADSNYQPTQKYVEGAHMIAVTTTPAGHIRRTSELVAPGRIVHIFNDKDDSPPKTYYYLYRKLSAESHTFKDAKDALAAVGVSADFARHYLSARSIDALLGIWTDIDYGKPQR